MEPETGNNNHLEEQKVPDQPYFNLTEEASFPKFQKLDVTKGVGKPSDNQKLLSLNSNKRRTKQAYKLALQRHQTRRRQQGHLSQPQSDYTQTEKSYDGSDVASKAHSIESENVDQQIA